MGELLVLVLGEDVQKLGALLDFVRIILRNRPSCRHPSFSGRRSSKSYADGADVDEEGVNVLFVESGVEMLLAELEVDVEDVDGISSASGMSSSMRCWTAARLRVSMSSTAKTRMSMRYGRS